MWVPKYMTGGASATTLDPRLPLAGVGGAMPELPDIVVYIESLDERILGKTLMDVRLGSSFVLRSVDPPINAAAGKTVETCAA